MAVEIILVLVLRPSIGSTLFDIRYSLAGDVATEFGFQSSDEEVCSYFDIDPGACGRVTNLKHAQTSSFLMIIIRRKT